MTPEQVLDHPALVLDQRARKRYFTNFGVLTFCVYLDDTGPEQGLLTAVPGTHRGPLFEQFDDGGRWTGALADRDVATLATDTATELGGPPGPSSCCIAVWCTARRPTTRRACARCCSTCTRRPTRCR